MWLKRVQQKNKTKEVNKKFSIYSKLEISPLAINHFKGKSWKNYTFNNIHKSSENTNQRKLSSKWWKYEHK